MNDKAARMSRFQLLPGDVLRGLMEHLLHTVKISANISRAAFLCMFRKARQGEHLPESVQIIVHNGTSLVV